MAIMNDTADFNVREACIDDLAAIADVFLACWHGTYQDVLPAVVVELHDQRSARALWGRILRHPRAQQTVLVLERIEPASSIVSRPGQVMGVIRAGRDSDQPTVGHVYSLYVHPDAQHAGAGTRLLQTVTDCFFMNGLVEATLWVFAANSRARAFYARLGWLPDGAERIEAEYGEPELRLRWRAPE
jgi:ribosomal protein S18 acetylase RimI-like enzyme